MAKDKNRTGSGNGFHSFFDFLFLKDGAVRWYDWCILLILILLCFFIYAMSDLFHTAACSYGYLDGHILDFYDYLAENGVYSDGSIGIYASYMPTVYILFALWNIPMKLFGVVPQATMQLGILPLMWAKLLPCLAFLASAGVVYLIGRDLGMGKRKLLILVYAYLSCPVLFYGQFVIGQYESFFTALVLLGFWCWLRKKDKGFLLCFGLALTFKYTALFVFIPLLLLREKKIPKIILYCGLVFVPYAAEYLLYMHSEVFRSYVFGIGSSGDRPTGYIENAALFTGFTFGGNLRFVIYILVVVFALICAYAYFSDVKEAEEGRFGLHLCCLSLAAFFCLSKWHSHWLMPLFAFTTISTLMSRRKKAMIALDLLFGVLFIMFCTCQFEGAHDEAMINNGVLKFFLPDRRISYAYSLTDYYRQISMSMELSFMTAIMVVKGVFSHPKYCAESADVSADEDIRWLRARCILPVLLLLIPTFMITARTIKTAPPVYEEDRRGIFVNMQDQEKISQPFVAEDSGIISLVFPVSRGAGYDEPRMNVSVSAENGSVLYEEEVDVGEHFEGQLVRLKPGELGLKPGETYYVNFEITEAADTSTFCLLAFDQGDYPNAVAGDRELKYHMDLRIYQ